MKAIYQRELQSYFRSMTGPVVVALTVCFAGIYFMAYNLHAGYPYFSYTLGSVRLILLMVVPLLTMRSMAEDRRMKTDQLWMTAPVSVGRVILGKYLAMVTVFAVPMLVLATCPLLIALNGTAYLLADYSTWLCFFLLGCVYIAVGEFISSLTENQIISAAAAFGALLLLYLWDDLLDFLPTTAVGSLVGLAALLLLLCVLLRALSGSWLIAGGVGGAGAVALLVTYLLDSAAFARLLPDTLAKFSLMEPFANFAYYHVFDLAGLLLYLSLIALLLFLTVQVVQKRRWN